MKINSWEKLVMNNKDWVLNSLKNYTESKEMEEDGLELTVANLVIPEEYIEAEEAEEEFELNESFGNEYQGKKVKLNKPFRTPDGPKKFSVYVKNEKGNVVKVNFGDPNMEIKKDNPERRKSFRARHNCDSPGPKWKARYWSCKNW